MIESITIPKDLPQDSALSYDFLRAEGIKHIQQLAGHLWTDHNTHDPGITILEQLCYAITDLGYRIDNDIKDLLGSNDSSSYRDLFSPATILTVNPVTLLDIRKVVIDIRGVKNAWVEKVTESPAHPLADDENASSIKLKGLYRIVFEKDESTEADTGLLAKVKAKLHACRGICEDFDEIKLLAPQPIRLNGTIEVGHVEDINQFAAHVMLIAAEYISPKIPFYSLQELLGKGKNTDEIFDGPALVHGFIDDEELRKSKRKQEIHASDLIREIMDKKGVMAVNELSISTGSGKVNKWVQPLDMAKTPKLDVRATLDSLNFAKQGLKASIDQDRVYQLYLEKRDALQFEELKPEARDIVLSETEDRSLESYYSIQNQFPANYGIGTLGLSESAPAARKAQAKQLKSYLLFFEQLLANYFSQTAHFKDLVSFNGEDRRSYFNQSLLESIPGLEDVVVSKESYASYLQEMTADSDSGLERKNAFLNHLLARFSEAFTDYGMFLHDPAKSSGYSAAQKLITDKSNFLKDYPALSSGRARAFDYTKEHWSNGNISGLEKRIARKLGVEDYSRRNLGDADAEGFHLVEHILLRPTANSPESSSTADQSEIDIRHLIFADPIAGFTASSKSGHTHCEVPQHGLMEGERIEIVGTTEYNGVYAVSDVSADGFEIEKAFTTSESTGRWIRKTSSTDPYSLQLTFVLPNWVERYQNETFKTFVDNTIREETPAHLTIYIQWLSKPEMQRFDQSYRQFLTSLNQR